MVYVQICQVDDVHFQFFFWFDERRPLLIKHEVAWGVVGKPSRTPNMHNHGTIKGPRVYMSCLQYFFEDDALLRVMHVEEKSRVRSCLGNIFLEDRACEPLVGHVASRVVVELLVTDQRKY